MNPKLLSVSLLALVALGGPAVAQDDGTYNWTDFYLGVNLGGAFLTSCPRFNLQGPVTGTVYTGQNCPKPNAFIGGGQAGFNYQFNNNFVVGIEGDVGGATGGARSYTVSTAGSPDMPQSIPAGTFRVTGGHTPSSIETIRGRFGYALGDALLFVTGGGTFAGGITESTATFTPAGGGSSATLTATNHGTRIGWNIGGGVEYHISGHWSVKIEDLYSEIGTLSNSPEVCSGAGCTVFPNALEAFNSRNYLTINVIRVGVNYLIGGSSQ